MHKEGEQPPEKQRMTLRTKSEVMGLGGDLSLIHI